MILILISSLDDTGAIKYSDSYPLSSLWTTINLLKE